MKSIGFLFICLFSVSLFFTPLAFAENADIASILKKNPEEVTEQDCLAGIKYSQEQLKLNPSSAETYYYLGIAYYLLGRYTEASDSLQQAIQLSPNLAEPYFFLGLSYKGLNKPTEAREAFLKSLNLSMGFAQTPAERWRLWTLRKAIE